MSGGPGPRHFDHVRPDSARHRPVWRAFVAVLVAWLLYAVAFACDTEDWSALVPVLLLASLVAADRWRGTTMPGSAVTVPRASTAPSSES